MPYRSLISESLARVFEQLNLISNCRLSTIRAFLTNVRYSTASPLKRCTAVHAGHSDTEKLHQVRLEAKAVTQREIMNSKVCGGSTLYRVSPDAERMYRKLGFDNACGSSSDNHSSLSIVDNRWSTVENCSWNQACFRTTTPAAPLIDVCCSHGASANATPGLEMPFISGFHAGVRW